MYYVMLQVNQNTKDITQHSQFHVSISLHLISNYVAKTKEKNICVWLHCVLYSFCHVNIFYVSLICILSEEHGIISDLILVIWMSREKYRNLKKIEHGYIVIFIHFLPNFCIRLLKIKSFCGHIWGSHLLKSHWGNTNIEVCG